MFACRQAGGQQHGGALQDGEPVPFGGVEVFERELPGPWQPALVHLEQGQMERRLGSEDRTAEAGSPLEQRARLVRAAQRRQRLAQRVECGGMTGCVADALEQLARARRVDGGSTRLRAIGTPQRDDGQRVQYAGDVVLAADALEQTEGLAQQNFAFIQPALLEQRRRQTGLHRGDEAGRADLPGQDQSLSQRALGLQRLARGIERNPGIEARPHRQRRIGQRREHRLDLFQLALDRFEPVADERDRLGVEQCVRERIAQAVRAAERDRGVEVGLGGGQVCEQAARAGAVGQHHRLRGGRHRRPGVEHAARGGQRFAEQAAPDEQTQHGFGDLIDGPARAVEPQVRGAHQVRHFGAQGGARFDFFRPVDPRPPAPEQRRKITGVAPTHHARGRRSRGQLAGRELAHQFVQAEPPVVAPQDQRLVDQRREDAQRRVGHRVRGFVGEAADEHRQRRQRLLLIARQQRPRGAHHGVEAALALGPVAVACRQRRHLGVDFGVDRLHQVGARNRPNPGGGQLQRERQPFGQPAQAHDVRPFGLRRKTEVGLPRALHEEFDRGVGGGSGVCCRHIGRRVSQTGQFVDPFLLQPQHFAARHQQAHARCLAQQGQHPLLRSTVGDQVLEVVEHQQALLRTQRRAQCRARLGLRRQFEAQRSGDRVGELCRRCDRCQRHPGRALRVACADLCAQRERQARLAHAAEPVQRQQPAPRVGEQALERGQLLYPPDEAGAGQFRGPHRSVDCRRRLRRAGQQGRADGFEQSARFGARPATERHRQLALADLVLRHRRFALAGLEEQLHQPAVRGLARRVECDPAACRGDGGLALGASVRAIELGARAMALDQAVENRLCDLQETRPFTVQPVVEFGRRIEFQVHQQRAAIQVRGTRQRVEVAGLRQRREACGVQVDRCEQGNRVALDGQARGHRRGQTLQCGAQAGARRLFVGAAPQKPRQVASRLAPATQGDIDEQHQRLLRWAYDRHAVERQGSLPKQRNGQALHFRILEVDARGPIPRTAAVARLSRTCHAALPTIIAIATRHRRHRVGFSTPHCRKRTGAEETP